MFHSLLAHWQRTSPFAAAVWLSLSGISFARRESALDGVNDDGVSAKEYRIGDKFLGPAVFAAFFRCELCQQTNEGHDRPIEPLVRLHTIAIDALDHESVFLKVVAQLVVTDGIGVNSDLILASAVVMDFGLGLFGERLEMRCIAKEEPLHALFDIQNVGNADNQMAARLEETLVLAERLWRRIDMLETIERGDVVEGAGRVRQR